MDEAADAGCQECARRMGEIRNLRAEVTRTKKKMGDGYKSGGEPQIIDEETDSEDAREGASNR